MTRVKSKPVEHSKAVVNSTPKIFYITIPRLNIKDAKVETDSTNLSPDHILGHYKGTAYPGELGNSLIYGHSVLPIFYSPKNYKTIFSTLPTLAEGDKFSVSFSGNEFEYKVVTKLTLKPDQVDVFDSNPARLVNKSSTVTLLTCVPPGSKTYRLLVVGELIKRK
jgi:sortase A